MGEARERARESLLTSLHLNSRASGLESAPVRLPARRVSSWSLSIVWLSLDNNNNNSNNDNNNNSNNNNELAAVRRIHFELRPPGLTDARPHTRAN